MASIFTSSIVTEIILPFVLVFVIIFAILQKSKILGDGKAQTDALVALAIALITVAFEAPRTIIISLMPWLSVAIIVMLVFFILYGFAAGDLSSSPKWMKITFGVLAGLFVLILVIVVTGAGGIIKDWFSGENTMWGNVILFLVVAGVIAVAVATGDKDGKKKD